MDLFESSPDTRRVVLHAFQSLQKWAFKRGRIPHQFTLGIEAPKTGEHHTPWTDEQVAYGEAHARADLSRAITLAANTGQRVSDISTMEWVHIDPINGRAGIWVTQKKTKMRLWIPFTRPLIQAMAGWSRFPRWLVHKPTGEPYSAERLSDTFWDHLNRQPSLAPLKAAGLVFHGLRGSAVVRLRRAGVSRALICDFVGMSSADGGSLLRQVRSARKCNRGAGDAGAERKGNGASVAIPKIWRLSL